MTTPYDSRIQPRKLPHDVLEYYRAPSGDGELAYTWRDKPHRLVYDLVAEVLRLRQTIVNIDQTLRVPAAEYVPAIGDVFTLIDNLELPEVRH